MPKTSASRLNRMRADYQCSKLVPANMEYLGYIKTIDKDSRVTLYAYSVNPMTPDKVTITTVNERSAILAAMEAGGRGKPRDPDAKLEDPKAPGKKK